MSSRASIHMDPRVAAADPARRSRILPILEAALLAVEPGEAVRRALHREGDALVSGGRRYALDHVSRVLVAGFGIAAAPMGQAVS
jgi:glycerate-2-kinase